MAKAPPPDKRPPPAAKKLPPKPALKALAPVPTPPKGAKPHKPQPAFPKKVQPPTAGAFAARLPLALGKRFDFARGFLLKQPGVSEDVFFYGPESGWALRYLVGERPLCSLHVYDEQPIGIISLDAVESAGVDWRGLSAVAQKARKQAHGSPALLWLDLPLEGTGAADLRALLRAKLAAREADDDDGGLDRDGHTSAPED